MSLKEKLALELTTVNPVSGEYIYTDLLLPALPFEIEDAMQRARITSNYADMLDISVLNCAYLPELTDTMLDGASIKELNLFAKRLQTLSDDEIYALNGVFMQQKENGMYENGISMEELINLTYGLDAVPIVHGIDSDEKIGEFVIDNNLCEELVGTTPDSIRFLDKALIGKAHRESEKGQFVAGNYAATAIYSFPQEYKGVSREKLKINNDIAFVLEVAEAPVNDSRETAETAEALYLPIPKSDADELAIAHNEKCIEDCVYYDFKSAIPGIDSEMFTDMQDFDKLNEIADRYISFSVSDKIKLKAVVAKECPKALEDVIDICNNLRRYELSYYSDDANNFAKEYLSHHLSSDFDCKIFDGISLDALGQNIIKVLGATVTPYGIVSERDGSLFEIKNKHEEALDQDFGEIQQC
ncbi:MAG: hypothetical protein Q4C12_01655 [Clostridia bacterium]|nr:hypothetical protein [Clostridia bacterium]